MCVAQAKALFVPMPPPSVSWVEHTFRCGLYTIKKGSTDHCTMSPMIVNSDELQTTRARGKKTSAKTEHPASQPSDRWLTDDECNVHWNAVLFMIKTFAIFKNKKKNAFLV